jgi:hypothetical protein
MRSSSSRSKSTTSTSALVTAAIAAAGAAAAWVRLDRVGGEEETRPTATGLGFLGFGNRESPSRWAGNQSSAVDPGMEFFRGTPEVFFYLYTRARRL